MARRAILSLSQYSTGYVGLGNIVFALLSNVLLKTNKVHRLHATSDVYINGLALTVFEINLWRIRGVKSMTTTPRRINRCAYKWKLCGQIARRGSSFIFI